MNAVHGGRWASMIRLQWKHYIVISKTEILGSFHKILTNMNIIISQNFSNFKLKQRSITETYNRNTVKLMRKGTVY